MLKSHIAPGLLLCTLIIAVPALRAAPLPATPIYAANQNPFVQIFGLPKAEPGTITPKGRLDAGFLYFVSNNAISNEAANGESIIWDGETAQYTFSFRYGATEHLEVGIDIPFVENSGGYLDSLIRNYHSMLGFPNDRQEQFDKNQIDYQVSDQGNTLYSMTDAHSGLGDIRLTAAIPLFRSLQESQRYLALRSLLKLPTGDADDLLGSGGLDAALGLAYSDYQTLNRLNTVLSAQLGMVYTGESDVLPSLQRQYAGYGGVSADWIVLDWLQLKMQLDVHSAFYDSELKQLGSSVQLLAGGAVLLPGAVSLDFGISEQLITDSTPDVGFYLLARHLF